MGTDNFTPSHSGRGREIPPQPGRHPSRSIQGTTFITILFLAYWISAPFGASPLESAGQPSQMEEKVDEILARVEAASPGAFVPHAEVLAAVSEMKSLGPSILPILTAKVPRLNSYVLTAAACVLKDAAFKPAGPVLAKLLGTGPVNPGSHGYEDLNSALAILRALGRTGGPSEVHLLAGILQDPGQDSRARRYAMCALGGIGTPEAMAAIEETLGTLGPRSHDWWWIHPTDEDLRRANAAAMQGRGAWIPHPDGGNWVLFLDKSLGGKGDVWLIHETSRGPLGPALFLGVNLAAARWDVRSYGSGLSIQARLEGDTLVLENKKGAALPLRLDLGGLDRDTDHDLLPDLVEFRLRLDPTREDTDGDGVPDAEDPTPNAIRDRQKTEEEEIAWSILQQFFIFERSEIRDGLAVIYGQPPLEWSGRNGPTISLDATQAAAFEEEIGHEGIWRISVRPGVVLPGSPLATRPILEPGDRPYQLGMGCGMLCGRGYQVVVRRVGNRWVMIDLWLAVFS